MVEALSKLPGHNYVIFTTSEDLPMSVLKLKKFSVINLHKGLYGFSLKVMDFLSYTLIYIVPNLMHTLYSLKLFSLLTFYYKFMQHGYLSLFEKEKLDLMIYPASSNLSFLDNTPSIVAIHDIMHRVYPRFPEVSMGGRWAGREYCFQNISKYAFRIMVDSDIGREDMIRFYKADPGKIIPLPFLPPSYLNENISKLKARRICDELTLPEKFIFYPAKFWPHKNHINLVKALNILKKKGRIVNLVLTGSKNAEFTTYGEIMKFVNGNGLGDQIFYSGYVDNEQISAIYKLAKAMVMPTYFGPTNIPILEAWAMGTPAIASDIRGCKDQLGTAGLLTNPNSPADIADKIWKVYSNTELSRRLVKKGRRKLMKWTSKDFINQIKKIIMDFEIQKQAKLNRNYV